MNPLHLRLNLSVFIAVLFLFGESLAQRNSLFAQESEPSSLSRHIDVFVSENKIVSLEHNVGEITNSNPEVVKGEKLQNSDNQFSLIGIRSGEGSVVVRSGNQVIDYHVSVGPMPERIYINIPESKRITFTDVIDDVAVSAPGILRIVQPSDNIVLLEALRQGKTTVTVTSKGEIYRYFVSTFDNRGADILEIENAFAAKGYRQLHVSFEKDQATVSGSVPTEEELDDAVRIVKQYTPYVIIKAIIGEVGLDPADSEDERVIINNIQRIAQVKGLIVRVQFPRPVETDSNTFTRVVGNPALTNTTVDNQTRLSTTNVTLPPDNSQGSLQKAPQEGTLESVNIVKNVATPEKIFLFGELATDNDEARAVRVARTFSPQVISFITVKDPMQLRIRMRLLQINFNKLKDVGVLWSDSVSPLNPPAVGFGFHSPNTTTGFTPGANPSTAFTSAQGVVNNSINNILYNLNIDANAQIRLLETHSAGRTVYDQSQLLTNGQPGEFFNGQQIPYVSGSTVSNGTTQFSTSFVNIGLGVTILPLNYTKAGGAGAPSNRITTTLPKYLPGVPGNVDESLKYVDENGLIGLDITTSLSALDTSLPNASNGFLPLGGGAEAPVTTSRLAVNRALLHDHQSVVAAGLFNDAVTRAVKAVPFFNRIPVFGFLFENPVDTKATFETVVVYTPELVKMSDPDTKRIPKPILPELQQEITKQGLIPLIKPVRFDGNAEAITVSGSPVVATAVDVNNTPVATPPPTQKTSSSTSKSKKVAAKKSTSSTSNTVATTTTTTAAPLPLPDNAFVQDVSTNPSSTGATTAPVTTTITTTTPTITSPATTAVPPVTTTTIVAPGTTAPTTSTVAPVTTTTTTTPGTTAVTTMTPETTTTVVTPTSAPGSTSAATVPGSVPPLQQYYYYGTESNSATPQEVPLPTAAPNQNGRLKMPSGPEETAPSSSSVTPALPSVDNPNVGENGANPTP